MGERKKTLRCEATKMTRDLNRVFDTNTKFNTVISSSGMSVSQQYGQLLIHKTVALMRLIM
jgi:hypothetical protein